MADNYYSEISLEKVTPSRESKDEKQQ